MFLILSPGYYSVSVKLFNNYKWAIDIKFREMREETGYVTAANQTAVIK
jgi:hypothetical protein